MRLRGERLGAPLPPGRTRLDARKLRRRVDPILSKPDRDAHRSGKHRCNGTSPRIRPYPAGCKRVQLPTKRPPGYLWAKRSISQTGPENVLREMPHIHLKVEERPKFLGCCSAFAWRFRLDPCRQARFAAPSEVVGE